MQKQNLQNDREVKSSDPEYAVFINFQLLEDGGRKLFDICHTINKQIIIIIINKKIIKNLKTK